MRQIRKKGKMLIAAAAAAAMMFGTGADALAATGCAGCAGRHPACRIAVPAAAAAFYGIHHAEHDSCDSTCYFAGYEGYGICQNGGTRYTEAGAGQNGGRRHGRGNHHGNGHSEYGCWDETCTLDHSGRYCHN